jgi:hypothetical protein
VPLPVEGPHSDRINESRDTQSPTSSMVSIRRWRRDLRTTSMMPLTKGRCELPAGSGRPFGGRRKGGKMLAGTVLKPTLHPAPGPTGEKRTFSKVFAPGYFKGS